MDMGWTEDRVATLKRLWAEGLSASQIAKQLTGVTRNAVIGKVHRLGLAGRATPSRPTKRPLRTVARPRPAGSVQTNVASSAGAKSRPLAPMLPVNTPPPIAALRQEDGSFANVLTLNERMCKWPIGDPNDADFAFCGRGSCSGSPYCGEHARLAYQPQQPKKKRSFGEQDELRRMMRLSAL